MLRTVPLVARCARRSPPARRARPRVRDPFGAAPGQIARAPTARRSSCIDDPLGIFTSTSGIFRGFPSYEVITPPNGTAASIAGIDAASPGIIGFRLGRGSVVEIGLTGFTREPRQQRRLAGAARPSLADPVSLGRRGRLPETPRQLARRLPDRRRRLEGDGDPAAAGLHALRRDDRIRHRRDARDVRDPRQHRRPARDDRVVPALLLSSTRTRRDGMRSRAAPSCSCCARRPSPSWFCCRSPRRCRSS